MSDLYNPNKKESGGPEPAPVTAPAGGGLPPSAPPRQALTGAGDAPEPAPVPDSVPVLEAVPVPSAGQANGTAPDRIRIGLWGAPRSGKTTYLTALPIAAMQYQRHNEGSWNIAGMTQEANAFLTQGVDLLTRRRAFPPASMGVHGMAWSVQGPEEKGKLGFRSRRPNFVLEIQDAAGEVFRHDHPQQAQLVGHLARSHGLIYLFDPVGDAEEATESFTYLQATLIQLAARVRDQGELVDGRLPHHVSVCIAKFDHPDVFRPAVEAGWVTQDTVGSRLPRVPREQSEKFFQWMCDEFRGSNARLVRDALYAHFDPRRISYYAASAVGFRLNPQHVFDYGDYVQPVAVDGTLRIRTSPVPINVLEPLIDLESRIHRDRGRGGGWRVGKRR
ncbi:MULTISPECIES: hypothetical protein [unclassified Streptomyces]|uniref:hypothetical protein n=1 Tax=unclassified Streptomyces TaxID=2593676 RepID=UPI002E81F8A7|nr:hypothetical protein [Streptomyces sp. NBC_00589]WTI35562.1 hypothetical protein OIC96_11420 [Streptomyces sp. NBC_00775]WUB30765.1 hypothetical protein OHA51_38310 [Streptomyces sp. NBC_00589]